MAVAPQAAGRGPHQAPSVPVLVRAAPPLPASRPAAGHPTEVHLHLHGVSAQDVAIIGRQQEEQ
jgi:hypothetical protein